MPRFNTRGDWCAGKAGGNVTVNGTVIATNAGEACWLDEDRVLYQHGSHLETFNVRTGQTVADFDPLGADWNQLAAGGGVYAAKFSGVVRTSTGLTWQGYIGDVGPDGTILQLDMAAMFQGRVVRFLQSLGGALWSGLDNDYRPVQADGVPVPKVLDGRTYGFRRAGEFCCYQTEDERVIVQHIDRAVGKVVAHARNAHRPDLVQIGDAIHVIYSTDEGESNNVLLPPVPISELTETLTSTEPPPPPPPEPKPMPVPDKSAFAASFLGPRLALVGSMDETRAHTFAAVREGCIELRKTDPSFGLLAKTSGDNVDGFAADIWLYDLGDQTAQVIDVVNNGEGAPRPGETERVPPSPGWGLKDIRPISQWREPGGGSVPLQTHAYDGGEHDTGTCDICGQPRNAPIHQVSQPGPVPAQRPDTAAVIATLQGAIAALARIAPDRPEPGPTPPPPPQVVVEREHPSYDDMMATIGEAAKAYGRKILPPETAAHLMFGYLIEGRTRESIVEDARSRGRG